MEAEGWKVLTAVFDPLAPCLFANPCGVSIHSIDPKLLDGGRAPAIKSNTIPLATLAHQLTVRD